MFLGYTDTRVCTSTKNPTWFTKLSYIRVWVTQVAIKNILMILPVKPTHHCISKHTLKFTNCTTLFLSFTYEHIKTDTVKA